MLPSSRRIRKTDFKLFGRSIFFQSPALSLSVYKKSDLSPSQFSFSVSKKVSKSAVKRNQLRRRGYASVGKIIDNVAQGYFFVFNFKKDALALGQADIFSQIKDLIGKSGLFK